jgi:methylase of polypeptide subunit release factors
MLNGAAVTAVASDVDVFALHLASSNASRLDVPLVLSGSPDPARLPPTPLTVCNMPTHTRETRTTC